MRCEPNWLLELQFFPRCDNASLGFVDDSDIALEYDFAVVVVVAVVVDDDSEFEENSYSVDLKMNFAADWMFESSEIKAKLNLKE